MSHPRTRLNSLEANARKSLSQNFLCSPHWIDRLAQAAADAADVDVVWEVGPGLGALTEALLKKITKPLVVFEFDRKLAADLRERFPMLEVVEGDFLKVDLAPRLVDKKVSFLSNLPYHLSSPILFRLLEHKDHFSRLVLTFQKEFADRLVAVPRTHAYGALSVLAQVSFRMDSLGVLPPGAFYPAPAVDSKALILTPLASQPVPFANLNRVVKAAFAHRRKKLISNLKTVFPDRDVQGILNRLGVAPLARAEELTKETYLEMTAALT